MCVCARVHMRVNTISAPSNVIMPLPKLPCSPGLFYTNTSLLSYRATTGYINLTTKVLGDSISHLNLAGLSFTLGVISGKEGDTVQQCRGKYMPEVLLPKGSDNQNGAVLLQPYSCSELSSKSRAAASSALVMNQLALRKPANCFSLVPACSKQPPVKGNSNKRKRNLFLLCLFNKGWREQTLSVQK